MATHRVVWGVLFSLVALAALPAATAQVAPVEESSEVAAVSGELIVGFRKGTAEAARVDALASAGVQRVTRFAAIDAELVRVPPERAERARKQLESHARVRYVEPNFILTADDHGATPDDPEFHQLWGLHNFGQTVNGVTGASDADIDAKEAWQVATGDGSAVVGVIDTGVDFGHPDLAGRMWTNPGESGGGKESNGVDDDGNGYVDDWRGWDWVNNDSDPFDDNRHGTHVAGTIGAVGNNGVGVAGVSWNVKIMALKFLGSGGSGTTANAVKAVLYAAAKGAHITNNSWGGGGFSQALLDAILAADSSGALFIASAGNSNVDTDTNVHYPSGYRAPNVISVAATDSSDAKASFSNYGRASVHVGAPGVHVYSTVPGGGYEFLSGTSMASPHVSGAAALAKSVYPAASDLGLKALLLGTADANPSLSGRTVTGSRLNVNTAVRCSAAPKLVVVSPSPNFRADAGQAVPVQLIATSCATPGGVSVSATGDGAQIALTARADGLYEGTYVAPAEGPTTVSATATVGEATATASVTGFVVQNYRYEDVAFDWIDATAGGTNLNITSDDTSVLVSLPFGFVYYGRTFTSIRVSSNGFAVFGPSTATAYANQPIPNATSPNGIVAPFWDDLNPSAGGAIWTRTIGTSPNRTFVIAWLDVPHYPNVGRATFQLLLREHQNDIVFQYFDVEFGDPQFDDGSSATIGVEALDGLVGHQFSAEQASLGPYEFAKSLRFTMAAAGWTGPTITTAVPLPDATLSVAYSQNLLSSGGALPLAWSIVGGGLPPGLALGSSDGKISGTATATGTFAFTARVADANGLSNDRSFAITVGTGIVITTESLPGGKVGESYSAQVTAAGGSPPYTWSRTSGSLPNGLSLSTSTGTISGTPSAPGTFSFTIQAKDSVGRTASKQFSIPIAPAPLEIVTSALLNGTKDQSYYDTLQAKGGKTPYTWSLASGPLPPGLAMDSAGQVTGTPTAIGKFEFTVSVTDSDSPAQTAAKSVTLTVDPAPLAIATASLPDAKVRRQYSQTLAGRGGVEPYTWSIASGALPPGLTLDSATGTIAGRPTKTGTYNFTIRLTDSQSPAATTTKPYSLKVVK
jgi:subtilisin family serine protease